jgi:hypothetical protein
MAIRIDRPELLRPVSWIGSVSLYVSFAELNAPASSDIEEIFPCSCGMMTNVGRTRKTARAATMTMIFFMLLTFEG